MRPEVNQRFAQALELEASGNRDEARRLIRGILETDPDHPGALQRLAEEDLRGNALGSARARFERALAAARERDLSVVELWFGLARVHTLARDAAAARRAFESMLDVAPGDPRALLGLASLALGERDAARAEAHARLAVEGNPDLAHAWTTLALALNSQQRRDEALECARRGCEIAPRSIALRRSHAAIALEQGDAAMSVAVCRAGLDLHPDDVGLRCSLADALSAAGALTEALDVLAPILESRQANAETWLSAGALCMAQGRSEEAVGYLRRAIEAGLGVARAWYLLGIACKRLKRLDDAVTALQRALALEPRLAPALSHFCGALRESWRWDEAERAERSWLADLDDPQADPRRNPFISLALATTPQQQLLVARAWSQHTLPRVAAPAYIASRGTRLRVGYLTPDFRAHPLSYLTAGLFECHDRSRFETFAYSYGPDDGSAIRRRVQAAFEHWTEPGAMSDDAFAQRIRADAVDVLVELSGHTGDRLGILARRPAPVQIHYLGYPGTQGFDGFDAIVADAVVAPPGTERAYHERLLRLPRCYMVTDNRRGLRPAPSRSNLGLPEKAVVLAFFNQAYKLTRPFFEIWCAALREHAHAVLWVYQPDPVLQARLRAEAARCNVAPERLVFAAQVDQESHIARLQAADLALDVLPYGSHTTGSDALWAAVPMLSCRGETFAGRVGASLLQAVGLSELVTGSLAEYGSALSGLVRDRDRLAGHKAYLEAERPSLSLFDTAGFTRDFEAMLEAAANAA